MPVVIYFVGLLSGFISLVQLILGRSALKVASENMSILVRSERKNRNIQFNDILYIESMSDYVRFVLREGDKVITREKIGHLSEKLPDYFIRIHRSFIVNRNLLTSFNREEVITGGMELPVSRTYRKEAINKLENQNRDSFVNHP
jgi:DNA-binding LytR/AlgR family response regulator